MEDEEVKVDETTTEFVSSRRNAMFAMFGLALVACLLHGLMDGRWTEASDLKAIGSRLNDLPTEIGKWKMTEQRELEPNVLRILRCYGHQYRVYQHSDDESIVNVAVLYGPRGPIAVHTPEVCYDSVGTSQTRPRRVETIRTESGSQALWSVEFAEDPDPEPSIDVWYAWSDGGPWAASKHPRFWFAESLYKVQVAGPVDGRLNRPTKDFLENFLPELQKVMN